MEALWAGRRSPAVGAPLDIWSVRENRRCRWLSYAGELDTCICIRTVVVKDGMAHIQAGGGTVADAKPAYEYNESVNKAKAVFRAVELACEQPDWA